MTTKRKLTTKQMVVLYTHTIVKIRTEKEALRYNHLPFNRNYGYRKDLAASMNVWGVQGVIVVIKTSVFTGKLEYYILDGQNRLATAMQLGLTVEAMIIDQEFMSVGEIVKFLAAMNSTQVKFQPEDYVSIWSYLGREDYKKLTSMNRNAQLSITTVAAMLYGIRTRYTVGTHIKDGTFVCNLVKEATYTLALCAQLSKYGAPTCRMALAIHYVASLPKFDEAKFVAAYIIHYLEIRDNNLDDFCDIFMSWL